MVSLTNRETLERVEVLEKLNKVVQNPLYTFLLKRLTGKCKKDGAPRLLVALDLFVGARSDACFVCKYLVTPLVVEVVKKGGEAFGLDEKQLKEKFKDAYWRRGLASVVKGLVDFGATKPFTPGAPFLVVWDFTYACNLKCKHCYSTAGKPMENEMSLKQKRLALGKLAEFGVTSIAFSGGEPLIHQDFFQILKEASDYGMFTALATNGTLLTKENVEKLKKCNLGYVQISLDGARPETHDAFRGLSGAFEMTIRGIKNAVEAGLFTEVATTATKLNYEEIPDIIRLCRKLKVDWLMIFNFVPTGRGRFITENDLSPEEREELLRLLLQENEKEGLTILSTAPQYARVALECAEAGESIVPTHFYNLHLSGQLRALSEFVGGCGAGRSYFALEPDGTIYPCVFLPLKIGNILTDDLEHLWKNNPHLRAMRNKDNLKGECGKCEFRYVCGGCRARAYGYFGDYLAPDPGCIKNAKFWAQLIKESKNP